MGQRVVLVSDGYRVDGCGADGELVNRFLAHLGARAFSSATVRAYAYDLLNFLRFLAGRDARLADVVAICCSCDSSVAGLPLTASPIVCWTLAFTFAQAVSLGYCSA